MGDYAIKVTVKNGRILKRMRELGIETIAELCRQAQVNQQLAGQIINLKLTPKRENGEWREPVARIAGILQCDPHELFNEQQREVALPRNSAETYMDAPEVEKLMGGSPEGSTWAKIEANRLLDTLAPRERDIMEARLQGETFKEIGKREGVCGNRIRQIEVKAMRKMKRAAAVSDTEVSRAILYGAEA